MTKYAEEVKNHARARWKAGDSLTQIVADLGAPKTTIRHWLEGHERGLREEVPLSDESAAAGQGPEIPTAPVLVAQQRPEGRATLVPDRLYELGPRVEFPDIDELGARLLVGSTNALAAIQRTATLDEWLQNQDASALAALYRIIADKLIRVLEATRDPVRPTDADSNPPS